MASGGKIKPTPPDQAATIVDLGKHRKKSQPETRQVADSITGGGPPPPPRGPSVAERKFAARKWNEQVKLVTSGLSGLGLGIFSLGFIQPLLKDASLLIREPHPGWYAIGAALHIFSHFIIRTELRRED